MTELEKTLSLGLSMGRGALRSKRQRGFSLFEMMVTLAVGLVMASVALPFVVGAVQRYRLNGVAQQTANLIDLARYTAIRLNKLASLQKITQNGNTVLFVDLHNDPGNLHADDPMIVLPSDMQVANGDSLTPPSTSMGFATVDFAGTISFDYRGVLIFPPGTSAVFLALGYTSQAQYGTRALTVTPMGQTKIWTAPASGTWTGM